MKNTLYRTLSELTSKLHKKGFDKRFKLDNGLLNCIENGKQYQPNDMEIIDYQRFEGNSNPDDMSIVFVIKCKDGNKGLVVSSYGTYANDGLLSFMDKVKISARSGVTGQ